MVRRLKNIQEGTSSRRRMITHSYRFIYDRKTTPKDSWIDIIHWLGACEACGTFLPTKKSSWNLPRLCNGHHQQQKSNDAFPRAAVVEHTHFNSTTAYTMNTKILSDYCARQSSCNTMHLSSNESSSSVNSNLRCC